jgi:hypothetical protein
LSLEELTGLFHEAGLQNICPELLPDFRWLLPRLGRVDAVLGDGGGDASSGCFSLDSNVFAPHYWFHRGEHTLCPAR